MPTTFDAIVIGGGAIGCSTAYFLNREGLEVALLDKNEPGREASWASAGMIGPTSAPGVPWYSQATALSKTLYDELDERLRHETGREMGYGGEGMLTIALSEAEADLVHREVQAQKAGNAAAELLSGAEAQQREPALPEETVAAAWLPDGRHLDARNYTQTLAIALEQNGVSVYSGHPVTGLLRDHDKIIGVQTPKEQLQARWIINAAGAWAGQIDSILTHPVRPLHGQIMALSGPPCGLRHNITRAGIWGYATPRTDGRVIVGATEDEWGYEKKITPDGMTLLGVITRNILPCLTNCRLLDIWSGLRPATPDGLPAIGPDPRVSGGFLWAAGHTASGMMQAPATAAVLTDLVLDQAPRIPIDQVRIDRFFHH